jgi:hypothetical protein
MKNRNLVIVIAALCMVIVGACFSSWDGSGDQGNIVINLGDGGARYAGAGPGEETTEGGTESVPVYEITLSGPGGEIIGPLTPTDRVSSFSVQPGPWNVLVRQYTAYGDKNALERYGEDNVEVKAGATVGASIKMRALEWDDLGKVLENAAENEVVMLTGNLTVTKSIEIGSGKSITLLAKDRITITKGDVINNSLLRVIWGSTLTLEGIDGGEIIIRGNNTDSNSSLFYVGTTGLNNNSGTGGTLIMNGGVTLTDNHATIENRGGAVVVQGGTFIMNGGTISRNSALNGGGVCVLSGTFTKNGGTIYGYTATDSNSNEATGGKGHAVYVSDSNYKDDTAGPDNKFINGVWTR